MPNTYRPSIQFYKRWYNRTRQRLSPIERMTIRRFLAEGRRDDLEKAYWAIRRINQPKKKLKDQDKNEKKSNTIEGKLYDRDAAWWAFDNLPLAVRRGLNDSLTNWLAVPFLEAARLGVSEERLLASLQTYDKLELEKRDFQINFAKGPYSGNARRIPKLVRRAP